jgi:hypothetical protein
MSNQRAGKWKPAAMTDNRSNGMQLVTFFKEAKEDLKRHGQDDAAFYFEQVEDWLREGKSLTDKRASYILGL